MHGQVVRRYCIIILHNTMWTCVLVLRILTITLKLLMDKPLSSIMKKLQCLHKILVYQLCFPRETTILQSHSLTYISTYIQLASSCCKHQWWFSLYSQQGQIRIILAHSVIVISYDTLHNVNCENNIMARRLDVTAMLGGGDIGLHEPPR